MKRSAFVRASALATLAFLGVLAAPRNAEASGYLTARFGADHGTPAQPNAFAIYFNPAALGGTKGTTITGDVSLLLRFARYERTEDALSPSDESLKQDPQYRAANMGTANLTNLLALPFVGVNTDFGTERLRGGFAAYVPFGGLATWDRREGLAGMPGTKDGVQRWHNISGQILEIYNTAAFAVNLGGGFSVGASGSLIIQNVGTVRARNTDTSDDVLSNGGIKEGRSYIAATGLTGGASLGVYYAPTDRLRFGLSYNSQPGFGETRTSGTLRTQLGPGSESKSDIDLIQAFPDIVRFGAGWRASNQWEVRGDFEFVRWSAFEKQCVVARGTDCNVDKDGRRQENGQDVQLNIPRNWDNAIGVRVGPAYYLNERTELFGSLGVTTPAVPKETIDSSTIDSTRLYFTAGARFELSKHFALGVSYNHIYFLPVDTKGANNQNIPDHPFSSPEGTQYNVSRTPSADGKYSSQIGFVNANVAYTF